VNGGLSHQQNIEEQILKTSHIQIRVHRCCFQKVAMGMLKSSAHSNCSKRLQHESPGKVSSATLHYASPVNERMLCSFANQLAGGGCIQSSVCDSIGSRYPHTDPPSKWRKKQVVLVHRLADQLDAVFFYFALKAESCKLSAMASSCM